MILQRVAEYEYIVKVDMDTNAQSIAENPDHKLLEHGGPVTVALLHNVAFACSEDRGKCSLVNVLRLNAYLLIHVR